jgi:hypothetical protein
MSALKTCASGVSFQSMRALAKARRVAVRRRHSRDKGTEDTVEGVPEVGEGVEVEHAAAPDKRHCSLLAFGCVFVERDCWETVCFDLPDACSEA